MESLGKILRDCPHVITVVDAIYDRIVFSGKYAPHLLSVCPDLQNQILALNGASKSYLMTGWRLGWLIGSKELIKIISVFQSQTLSCANTIAQKAFEDAFEMCEEDIKNMVQELKFIRNLLTEGLKNISGLKIFPSEGAFYLWLGVQNFFGKKYKGVTLNSSKDIVQQLLVDKNLLCISGEEFGQSGYLRLSYVVSETDIKKAISRFQDFFLNLT